MFRKHSIRLGLWEQRSLLPAESAGWNVVLLSEQRDENGNEILSNMELLRLAMPRRVFTLSQVKYAVNRIGWLYENRKLVEGLIFDQEPKVLRFFLGRLRPVSDWQHKLAAKFRADLGDCL